MSDKNSFEKDVIKEIINIGIGEAANSLSKLFKDKVLIKVPELYILNIARLPSYLKKELKNIGIFLTQEFDGSIAGQAILTYTREYSISFLNTFFGEKKNLYSLTDTDIATLQEIGNIILGSCISTISNVIEGKVTFAIPEVTTDISEGYFLSVMERKKMFDKCVLVKNTMRLKERDIEGYIILLLNLKNFMMIIDKITHRIKHKK